MTASLVQKRKSHVSNLRVILFWMCMVGTLLFALAPSLGTVSMPTIGWDKADHVLAFGVLTVMGCRAYPLIILRVVFAVFCYGGLLEILQSLTPYREGSWLDLIADTVGIIAAYALVRSRLLPVIPRQG